MKVDFIICTNSDLWYSECVKYIDNLIVPDNVEIGVIGITDASGMAEGYELGRNSSEADYKVYLHQDTFIINRHFIEDIDAVFRSDDRIGIIGMVGNDDVKEQRFSHGSWRCGKVIACMGTSQRLLSPGEIAEEYRVVDCLDGMILITRYDVPWRQDIFTGWHFYDRSICLEYSRRGYLCVVPRQESPWCIHANGVSELNGWNDTLSTYLQEYRDFFQAEIAVENIGTVDQEIIQQTGRIADLVESLINRREMEEAAALMREVITGGVRLNKKLVFIWNLLEIWEVGQYNLFFRSGDSVSDMQDKYSQAAFLFRRKMYGISLDVEDRLYLTELTASEKSVILRHEVTLHTLIVGTVARTEVLDTLEQVVCQGRELLQMRADGKWVPEIIAQNIQVLPVMIDMVEGVLPSSVYMQYDEFFTAFSAFCAQCADPVFLLANGEELLSSLELFIECMDDLKRNYRRCIKRCPICGHEVMYSSLPEYYQEQERLYRSGNSSRNETLSLEEYLCPACGASDRDRLIISFLDREGLQQSPEGLKLLQIAPAHTISKWISLRCPHIAYDTTDLYMENVSFQSDIMDMHTVPDETYDVIICSHVLEHVRDDRKALSELKRILKTDGKVVFLVPVDLNATSVDEEWGLTEAENWRRFGQGDHCRRYDKEGLIQRLEEQFFVHSLGREYFGEETFAQCGLTDTSTLYILTKSREVSLNLAEEIVIDEQLCREGPMVSVIMSCYNHEIFVADTIESVINQTYKNVEFLVADDGSSDDSALVMQRYSKFFTKEFYYKDNIGGRVDFLMEQAKGKYIALINSDDVWEKDKLALQVKYMEEHEECGACFTWCTYTDEKLIAQDDDTFLQGNKSSSEWMLFFWRHGNVLCNPSSLIPSDLCRKRAKYGSACWQLPDFFRWVEMVQHTSIYIMPKFLIKMRRYSTKERENVSACSEINLRRCYVEEKHNWFWVIRDMDNTFFKEAFREIMVNPDASTEQEIKCEKYFLMLRHNNRFIQDNALCYFFEIFNDVRICMEEKYSYTIKDFKEDLVNKGLFSGCI